MRQGEKEHSQTQLLGRLRLVMTSTLPAARAMGIAQHTMRGVERPLLVPIVVVAVRDEMRR